MELARRELAGFFQSLDVWGDPYAVKAALLAFVPDLVQTYGDTAAVLAADYYDMLRDVPPSAASFRAVLAQPPVTEQVQATTRWAIGPLFSAEPDPVSALSLLSDSAQRLILQSGRDTVFGSAWSDPVTAGVARVPSGADTCEFCVMLASRGPVYRSEASAGESTRFHDGCDCTTLVVRVGEPLPDGYDPDRYYDAYMQGSGTGRYSLTDS